MTATLLDVQSNESRDVVKLVEVVDLRTGMVLDENIYTQTGKLLVCQGE